MEIHHLLSDSIQTGFINQLIQSNKEYRPELLTNDPVQNKKVLTSIIKELEQCDEFWFSVAFITTGGIATIINTLIELRDRNIKGNILASQYLNFTQPEALKRLKQFSNIDLRIAISGELHSKGYLFRKGDVYSLIIGSSNLTQNALSTNKEWNLKVSAASKSELLQNVKLEFQKEFSSSLKVTDLFIEEYSKLYNVQKNFNEKLKQNSQLNFEKEIIPNKMQREALLSIVNLRNEGKNKALLISATGTGKTYLSAFDVQSFKPKKFLFVVHRRTIALESMKTFKSLLGPGISMGLYSGDQQELEADYLFATIQTISKSDHLHKFSKEYFDYIVIDETHRAGANSYTRIMDHFNPKFLLGMTATPERTDGLDIFKLFDYNIAYEIRLHSALAEGMLSPFHYYGVSDLTINGETVNEKTEFNYLTAYERIDRIIEKAKLYGTDDGENIRGLVFCSRKEECHLLAEGFNQRGYNVKSLTGESSEEERRSAIDNLESDDQNFKLDYIFTVDIFNEGVDIPKVNQIIMLRPTQSAIIFVQQLGRGLRKIDNKEYLTVIDFIGNYANNYLVPIALYGDNSYNKDRIRKLIKSGSRMIPGSSTINFDRITKEKIFAAIDSANMQMRKDLSNDYRLLKYKLGHIPMMMDFLLHGARDPYSFVSYSRSYFNFVAIFEDSLKDSINPIQRKILELFSTEINNSKRIEESLILQNLLLNNSLDITDFKNEVKTNYGYELSRETIISCINNLNFRFITESKDKKKMPAGEIHQLKIVEEIDEKIYIENEFIHHLENSIFRKYLEDNTDYAISNYDTDYLKDKMHDGFQLYKKYSRKDVFRLLNWDQNPVAQNVGGYMISPDKTNCPIFVNYHKADDISSTTKYEDGFIDQYRFKWMSKSRRTLASQDVQTIRDAKIRLPLFVKKSNDEGLDFYYMGDLTPLRDSFEEAKMEDDSGKFVSVVKVIFKMGPPVEDEIYEYITTSN